MLGFYLTSLVKAIQAWSYHYSYHYLYPYYAVKSSLSMMLIELLSVQKMGFVVIR